MANQPIPVKLANDMVNQYLEYIKKLGVDTARQTHNVSFTGKELLRWLNDVMPFANDLRVCVGVYPDGHEHAGRITAILWPYKDGKPATRPKIEGKGGGGDDEDIPPYNEGDLKP